MSEVFNTAFNTLSSTGSVIPFNPAWANGTGYFDHAVDGKHAPTLAPGQIAASTQAEGPGQGRRLILIGTGFGNVVLFTRYSGSTGPIVYNIPRDIEILFAGMLYQGAQSESQLDLLLGSIGGNGFHDANIGTRLQEAVTVINNRQAVTA